MARQNKLFRESALERLSSPEQLDRLLKITRPQGWAALVAIWALLAVIIAWSFVGRIHSREPAKGILVAGGRLQEVATPYAGRLIEIKVAVGDDVERGQVVGVLDTTELHDRQREVEAQIEALTEQHQELEDLDQQKQRLNEELATTERARYNQEIENAAAQIVRIRQQLGEVNRLIDEGILPDIKRYELEDRIEAAASEQNRANLALEQLDARMRTSVFERQRDHRTRAMKMAELVRRRDMLDDQIARESTVRSALDGTIVEIRAAEHSTINAGDAILLIEPSGASGEQLEAILYVSAGTGKRIEPGMEVHLNPSTVRQEEYGSMKGRVEFIAGAPTSTPAMMAVLSDRDLVEELTREVGVPLMMRVALIGDESTPSGYSWTSSEGPPLKVSAGTLCRATVSVKTQRPIELVIPMIRSRLDGE